MCPSMSGNTEGAKRARTAQKRRTHPKGCPDKSGPAEAATGREMALAGINEEGTGGAPPVAMATGIALARQEGPTTRQADTEARCLGESAAPFGSRRPARTSRARGVARPLGAGRRRLVRPTAARQDLALRDELVPVFIVSRRFVFIVGPGAEPAQHGPDLGHMR